MQNDTMMLTSETDDSLSMNDDRRLSLIDVSSADDSLIANPSHHQHSENDSFLRTPNSRKFEDAAVKLQEWERETQPNEIENPNRNSKCNLRKSLAWDKAFFTSPGVLDPEELSSMIEGADKGRKHVLRLPGIQENVQKSCECISTLESDNSTLENLEAGLFEDVRSSILKFSSTSNVSPGSANSKVSSGLVQTSGSSKKDGMVSCNKASSSKSSSASMQGKGMASKKNPISPQLPRPAARREEPPISKQPRTIGKSSPSSQISSKRASIGDLHVKSERDKAKRIIGKVNPVTNTSIKNSRAIAPKPPISSKSPSHLSAVSKTKSTISTSSSSNLSGNIDKSPLNSLKRKVDAGTKKSPSSCSFVRTPPRTASRDKIGSSNASLSSILSVTNLSSSISPASSISDQSSESSSSTSTKYRSNSSRTNFGSRSRRKDFSNIHARQGSISRIPQSDSSLKGKQTQHTGVISQRAKTAAPGNVLPLASKNPSSLRLPSPKIGFFDGVTSSVRAPRGGLQPHSVVAHGLPKHGAGRFSPSESQNKAKLGRLQPARSITSIENKKINNQQDSHPIPLHESSGVAVNTSKALQHDKSHSAASKEVQSKIHLKTDVGNLDANNTVVEGHSMGDQSQGSTQEKSHYDDQVHYLSKQVGLMDINSDGQR